MTLTVAPSASPADVVKDNRSRKDWDLTLTPDELERRREIEALHEVRGYGVDLRPDQQLLGSILRTAVYHDTVYQHLENNVYTKLGLHNYSQHQKEHDDGDISDLVFQAVQVSAALAAAALRRIPSLPVFVKAAAGKGVIEELAGEELDAFMRPIFEESGMGDRFELRSGYHVYGRAKDAQESA